MARPNNITFTSINEEGKRPATPADRPYDGYHHLEDGIRESFEKAVANNEPLFTTDVSNLYDRFLLGLPVEARQHYNCNACRRFVDTYGGLVTIDSKGMIEPVMWNADFPDFFNVAVALVYAEIISKARVTGVFVTSEKRLGVARTGIWSHMCVDVPENILHTSRLDTAYQAACKKNEDFKMLQYAYNKYSTRTVMTAVNLLRSESLYRGEKTLGVAEWFLVVKEQANELHDRFRTNYLWLKAATAPSGFCHVSSSMIGTFLDDIHEGYELDTVKARFNAKMNPLKYQRPQVAPGRANVARAEEIIKKLNMQTSLVRRFARIEEVKLEWSQAIDSAIATTSGVFAGIKTKDDEKKELFDRKLQPDATTMTWEKFRRTVLPHAMKIEMYVSDFKSNFAALVGPADYYAPPIIVWDTEENRNPINWYLYSGGSYASQWNLPSKEYVEVTGITLQPNLWQPGFDHHGNGVFFLLKDCKDKRNYSSALFPETLKGELREIRATIEAYSKRNKLADYDEASACGLCFQERANSKWECKLRVTTDVGVRNYILNRWD